MNDVIGSGQFPERSTEISKTANNNLLITIVGAAMVVGGPVITNGIANSIPANLASDIVTTYTNNSWIFILENWSIINELAAASGQGMNWVTPVLEWIKKLKSKLFN